MYAPRYHREDDRELLLEVLESMHFGCLVGADEKGVPVASHIPMQVVRGGDDRDPDATLIGHVARANPLWRLLDPARQALAIFSGPDAYVSPRWYGHTNVPTWNYLAIHVYGRPELVDGGDALRALVAQQVERYEPPAESDYSVDALPERFRRAQLRGIVGFRLPVERIEGAFKLSQNRNAEDYANVIAELEKRGEPGAAAVAELMRRRAAPKAQLSLQDGDLDGPGRR